MRYLGILGTGAALPEARVGPADFLARGAPLELLLEWDVGFHRVASTETAAELEARAALQALERAGWQPADLDLIIGCTLLRGNVSHEIGATHGAVFEIDMACVGPVPALAVADSFFRSGQYRRILVVASSQLRAATDEVDPAVFAVRGDGAAAVVLGEVSEPAGVIAHHLAAKGRAWNNVGIEQAQTLERSLSSVPNAVSALLDKAHLAISDVDWVCPYQNVKTVSEAWIERIGVRSERVIETRKEYGNVGPANVLLNLNRGVEAGNLRGGDTILVFGQGSGVSVGAMLLRWYDPTRPKAPSSTAHRPAGLASEQRERERQSQLDRCLDELRRAADHMADLPRTGEPVGLAHQTLSALHGLLATAGAARDAGAPPDKLRDGAAPARALCSQYSRIIAHTQTWPHGHPGDFELIERLLDVGVDGEPGSLGYALDATVQQLPIVWQHRAKVAWQARLVRQSLCQGGARVLSIGCGGSRDLALLEPSELARLHVTLSDVDGRALELSRERLEHRVGSLVLVRGNALRTVNRFRAGGPFDGIVIGGLLDYLPERAARLLLNKVAALLAPGGTMGVTNVAAGNPWRLMLELVCDWPLIERTAAEMTVLLDACGLPFELKLDQTRLTWLATVGARDVLFGEALPR
jgi:3-oxoacyl-[acyl-carrier-protein] synthase III/SAM-dependent methyltransferase